MRSDAVRALVGGGPPSGGVFYLHGDDAFRKEQAARELVELHLDPATADFNHDRLRGPDTDVEQLASILATPPMMAEWRVVSISEAEAFAGSPRARALLLETASAPPPGLALILVATKPGGSKAKFYREIEKASRSLAFQPLSPDDVPGWLMERAREELGTEMDPEAARALGQAVGTDLGILAQELAKLAGVVREGEPITRADVESAGTVLPVVDRWGWFEDVGEKRLERAVETLPTLLSQTGETGVGLAIGLATHLLRLGVVVEGGPSALERILPPRQSWLARKFSSQARRWRPDEIADAIDGLRRVDRLLKSTPLEDRAILEEWLLTLLVRAAA